MEQAGGDEPIDTLADLAAALHDHEANTVRLALAAAALADRGDWALDGSVSMTAWLRTHLRMLDNDAHELLRAGRFYTRSAPFAAAVTDGTLSAGQATLMRRAIRPDTETIFDQQHTELVDILAPLDLAHTKLACHTWRARADAIADPEPRPVAPTELSHAVDDNGQACGRFVLSPMGTLHFEKRWPPRRASSEPTTTDARANGGPRHGKTSVRSSTPTTTAPAPPATAPMSSW